MTPPQARPGSGRAGVADVSALVLADPHGSPLDDLLAALAAQDRPAQRVLVCGLDPHGAEAEQALAHPGLRERRIPVLLGPAPPDADQDRWQVVEGARAVLPVHEDNWLWVLPDDSLPEPGALAALTGAVRRSSRVGMVGPKLVRADDPRLLVGVGEQVTVAGREGDPAQAPRVDQGQLDLRQDVLAVPMAGALVRSDLLARVGGLDPAFGSDGVDGLDVGWRLHLAGHRVVVAPDAVVHQGERGLGVRDPRRTRVRTRQLALARGSFLASLPRALGVIVTSTLATLLLLLVKRPTEAADEWSDVGAALAPWRGWGARWRFRGRRRVRPRDLRGLFLPPGTGWRSTVDTVSAALDPRARSARAGRAPARGRQPHASALETGPVAEELAELGPTARRTRRWSWPLAAALLTSLVLALWQFRSVLGALRPGGPGLAGGELGGGAAGAGDLWRSALDPWRGGGLGHDAPAEAWLVPVSVLTGLVEILPGSGDHAVGTVLAWLLLLAMPLSVLTAYLGLRRATRRGWVRAGLALGYAGLLPLTAAVADGRVGPVVVHVLAPLLVAGYAVCAAREGGSRRAAAAFATALGVTLAAQWVPLVLVLATLGGSALLVAARGRARWRGFVVAALPWVLMAPWWPHLRLDPTRLLGGAGAGVLGADRVDAPAWGLALLQPGGSHELAGSTAVSTSASASASASAAALDPWTVLAAVGVGLLWLTALCAVALAGRRGRRAGLLMGVATASLGLAILVERVTLGVLPEGHELAGQGVTAWPGSLLSFTGAALVLGAALLLDRLLGIVDRYRTTTTAHPSRWAGALIVTAAVLGVAVPTLVAASTAWEAATTEPTRLGAATDPVPAVAAEQGRGPSAVRTLVLEPRSVGVPRPTADGVGSVHADLVGTEPEPARILRDRVAELAADRALADPVEELVLAVTGAGTGEEALGRLAALGVGYVLVQGTSEGPVVEQIDQVPRLTRVSSPPDQVLWRLPGHEGARVKVVDAAGAVIGRIDVTGAHAAAEGALPEEARRGEARVVVAEGEGWARHAVATVDGERVELAEDGTLPLGQGASQVSLSQGTPALALHLFAAVLGLITIFLALPFGRVEPEEESA